MENEKFKDYGSLAKSDSLKNALDEIVAENKKNKEDGFSRGKKTFNKSYDPFISFDEIIKKIKKADKKISVLSFSHGLILFNISILLSIVTTTYNNQFTNFFSILIFIIMLAFAIILSISSNIQFISERSKLLSLRIAYFDKEVLEEMYKKRKNEVFFSYLFSFLLLMITVALQVYSSHLPISDYKISILLFIISICSAVLIRTYYRADTIKKLLNTAKD